MTNDRYIGIYLELVPGPDSPVADTLPLSSGLMSGGAVHVGLGSENTGDEGRKVSSVNVLGHRKWV